MTQCIVRLEVRALATSQSRSI